MSQACHFPSIWEMINKESPKTLKSQVPNSRAIYRSTMHALYSVTLLVQSKFKLTKIGIYWLMGETKTAHTPFLVELAAPSK